MPKIVFNACYGGFGLSNAALLEYNKRRQAANLPPARADCDIARTDPLLVEVIELLGSKANASHSNLLIRELPSGTKYRIDDYDGNEQVYTIDEYEWSIA